MRGSPSCVIAVRRFGAWRVAVCIVTAAALASLVAWVLFTPLGHGAPVRIAAGLASLAALAVAASLCRMPAGALRWDGSGGAFAGLSLSSVAPTSGELEVAIDLGAFLLLRFTSRTVAGRRSIRWIPVGRRGLEREWHSFRCAVYSPRPAAGTASAAASPHP